MSIMARIMALVWLVMGMLVNVSVSQDSPAIYATVEGAMLLSADRVVLSLPGGILIDVGMVRSLCVCVFLYVYACMYVYMHTCIYVCNYICMYVCIYACMYVCMYACMHVCMYDGWMYVSTYVCKYVWMYVNMYGCMYIGMYIGISV